jgi:hypothetical protein
MTSKSQFYRFMLSALGLAVVACGQDRPANDASNVNATDRSESSTGLAPTGNSTPTDSAMGTSMTPQTDSSSTDPSATGSGSGNSNSGSGGH